MTLWRVEYTESARKTLDKLDKAVKDRIESYMDDLCELENPKDRGKGLTGSRAGQWRYRVGDYRIICEIQGKVCVVLVLEVGHRSKVYKT